MKALMTRIKAYWKQWKKKYWIEHGVKITDTGSIVRLQLIAPPIKALWNKLNTWQKKPLIQWIIRRLSWILSVIAASIIGAYFLRWYGFPT